MKKGHPKYFTPPPPYSVPFLSVLHQNKALYYFHKREQRSVVEHNIGLEIVKERRKKVRCSQMTL